jgi:hypothetical protein
MNYSYCDIGNILLNGPTDKNTVHQYGISYNLKENDYNKDNIIGLRFK